MSLHDSAIYAFVASGVAAIAASLWLATMLREKFKHLPSLALYGLPILGLIFSYPISWIPAAYAAGMSFAWASILKISMSVGMFAFGMVSLLVCMSMTWMVVYPLLKWLNSRSRIKQ